MEYPQASALEARLKQVAVEVGDSTAQPFRVDLVLVHGGRPPVYSVVIRSSGKASLRHRLEQLLTASLPAESAHSCSSCMKPNGCSVAIRIRSNRAPIRV